MLLDRFFDIGDQVTKAHTLTLLVERTFKSNFKFHFFGFGQFNFSFLSMLGAFKRRRVRAGILIWAPVAKLRRLGASNCRLRNIANLRQTNI